MFRTNVFKRLSILTACAALLLAMPIAAHAGDETRIDGAFTNRATAAGEVVTKDHSEFGNMVSEQAQTGVKGISSTAAKGGLKTQKGLDTAIDALGTLDMDAEPDTQSDASGEAGAKAETETRMQTDADAQNGASTVNTGAGLNAGTGVQAGGAGVGVNTGVAAGAGLGVGINR